MIYTVGKSILCPGCKYRREEIETENPKKIMSNKELLIITKDEPRMEKY